MITTLEGRLLEILVIPENSAAKSRKSSFQIDHPDEDSIFKAKMGPIISVSASYSSNRECLKGGPESKGDIVHTSMVWVF